MINYPAVRFNQKNQKSVLDKVTVSGTIDSLFSRVTIVQEYHNPEDTNVEAVYTFPLPVKGVLLDLEVTIGERKLKGVVTEKDKARNDYEDAIVEGNTAIMLEQLEPGMYSMNVGNLQAGEKVSITFTYAELLRWQDGSLRFFLPTTIAPRYGNPERAGIEEHQVPETDLLAENKFSLQLKLSGPLAGAKVTSPSHAVDIQKDDQEIQVSLNQAMMDRDFICLITMDESSRNLATIGKDLDGYVAMAAMAPQFPEPETQVFRRLTMIIDCSGSMAGDSIAQASRALREITTMLRPQDRFNIIAFGSTAKALFPALVPADQKHLGKAKHFIRQLDASMGGTQIDQAISLALNDPASEDILLVTDGEVWNAQGVVEQARKSGRRFFTIGVGSAVAEGFVRSLAEETGGACELVSPNETMADNIIRHARRIFSRRCKRVQVSWPGSPAAKLPLSPGVIYDGDTVFLFARYQEPPTGTIQLTGELEDGSISVSEAVFDGRPVTEDISLARLVARQSMIHGDDLEICLKYQLMGDKTSYLVVDDAGDKAAELPALRKVGNMLAAGWGGSGTVMACDKFFTADALMESALPMFSPREEFAAIGRIESFVEDVVDYFSTGQPQPLTTFAALIAAGVPENIVNILKKISGHSEKEIVAAFLMYLAGKRIKNKTAARNIRFLYKSEHLDRSLLEEIGKLFTYL